MAEDYSDDDVVSILPGRSSEKGAVVALKSPAFIIRHEGVLYATVGVLEYDVNETKDPKIIDCIEGLEDRFDKGLKVPEMRVQEVILEPPEPGVACQQTNN